MGSSNTVCASVKGYPMLVEVFPFLRSIPIEDSHRLAILPASGVDALPLSGMGGSDMLSRVIAPGSRRGVVSGRSIENSKATRKENV